MIYIRRWMLFAVFVIVLAAGACVPLSDDIQPPPGSEVRAPAVASTPTAAVYYPFVPPNPQAGATIYAEKCQPCHGDEGLGNGPKTAELPNPVAPIGSFELARAATPAQWYKTVTEGRIDMYMPPFNSLSDRQRWDVVAYAFSLSVDVDSMALGQELYIENCAGCHGDTGAGDGVTAASLQTRPTNFMDLQTMAELSDLDIFDRTLHPPVDEMPAFTETFSTEERWALTVFLRSLTYTEPGKVAISQLPAEGETAPVETGGEAPELAQGLVSLLSGKVENGSGTEIPAGLQAVVFAYDNFQQVFTQTLAITDGVFSFEDQTMLPGRAYIASVDFQGVTFTSDIVVAENEGQIIDLPIRIYETTTDQSALMVDRLHIFFEFLTPELVRVAELFIVSNPDSRVVVASEPNTPVLNFSLPDGATNLQFQDGQLGGRYVSIPNGFGDTQAIYPAGQNQILFSFDMPYDREADISQTVDLPVNAAVAMLPEMGIDFESAQFLDSGTRDVQGEIFRVYASQNQQAGTRLEMVLSGKPKLDSTLGQGSNSTLTIGLAVLGGAMLIAGVWLYRHQRLLAEEDYDDDYDDDFEHAVEDETGDLLFPPLTGGNPESVMDAIIALDEQYQAGKLPEAAYQQRRSALKEHLRELLES